MEILTKYWEEIKKINANLDNRKRMFILGSATATVFLIVILVTFATKINYGVLFSGLDPNEAGVIVEKLKEQNVSYQLKGNGNTILVPNSKVYDLRLEMAAQGLPQTGIIGYEIFDKNNIGTTDFIQKINARRALEGELSRTIATLNEVKSVRLHLVIPEPSLFLEDKKDATSSIALNLLPGHKLNTQQIQGISNLVAASVEGLSADNVTIIDSFGNILKQPANEESLFSLSSNQMEIKRNVENYYSEKLKSLLENVVGKDRVAVQVTAELNFDRVDRTVTKFDPDNIIVVSEQKNTHSSGTDNNNPDKTEDVTTNYEVSRTVERIIQDVGNIKRISVAVMVDGKYQTPAGGTNPQYVAYTSNELTQLDGIVKSAVGFAAARGDEVKVVNLPFDYTIQDQEAVAMAEFEKKIFWENTIKKAIYLLVTLAIAFAFFKIYRSFKTIIMPYFPNKKSLVSPNEQELELDLFQENPEHVQLQKTIAKLSKTNPGDAAKLVKAWLVEDAYA